MANIDWNAGVEVSDSPNAAPEIDWNAQEETGLIEKAASAVKSALTTDDSFMYDRPAKKSVTEMIAQDGIKQPATSAMPRFIADDVADEFTRRAYLNAAQSSNGTPKTQSDIKREEETRQFETLSRLGSGTVKQRTIPEVIVDSVEQSNELARQDALRKAKEHEAVAVNRKAVAEESPYGAAALSGIARIGSNIADIPQFANDALKTFVINPVLHLAGQDGLAPTARFEIAKDLQLAAEEFTPEIKDVSKVNWTDPKDVGNWAALNALQQAPQLAMGSAATFIPKLRAAYLGLMGAMTGAGEYQNNLENGHSMDTSMLDGLTKGSFEIIGEMMGFNVYDKLGNVISKMNPLQKAGLAREMTRKILVGTAATVGQMGAGAVEEGITQVGQNASSKYVLGDDNVGLTDGLANAMAVGALIESPAALRLGAKAVHDDGVNNPTAASLGKALFDSVEGSKFVGTGDAAVASLDPVRAQMSTVPHPNAPAGSLASAANAAHVSGAAQQQVQQEPVDQGTDYAVSGAASLLEDTPTGEPVNEDFSINTPIDAAAHEAATSPLNDLAQPTDAQKAAGNYKKGHINVQGIDIAIENPRGSTRSGTDVNGEAWSVTMPNHYGYIKRSKGADSDAVDAYIGDNPESTKVFVVDQIDHNTGKFDEHKVMIGFNNLADATAAYQRAFNDGNGESRIGAVTPMSVDQFKGWLKTGNTTQPLSAAHTVQKVAQDQVAMDNTGTEVLDNAGIESAVAELEDGMRGSLKADIKLSTSVYNSGLEGVGGVSGTGAPRSVQLAKELAKLFKQKLVFFKNNTPNLYDINGAQYNGKIYVSEDTNRPAHIVFGHEFLHQLKKKHPEIYKKLMATLEPMMRNLPEFRKLEGIESHHSDDYVKEELAGNLFGNRFTEKAFWKMLASKMPESFQKMADVMMSVLNQIKHEIYGKKVMNGDAFIADINRARIAIADAVTEFQAAQNSKEQAGDVKFAKKFDVSLDELAEKERTYKTGVAREDRKTTSSAKLSDSEKEALPTKELQDAAIKIRNMNPVSAGWSPIEFIGFEEGKVNKKGEKGADKPIAKTIPYSFNVPDGATKAPILEKNTEWQKTVGNRIVKEISALVDRAKAGDKSAKEIIAHKDWYRAMASRLRDEFGAFGDMFADLLGATSPNTDVAQNWKYSVDILRRFVRGDFDSKLEALDKHLSSGGTVDQFKGKMPSELITQLHGAKYGMNSDKAMKALLGMWRQIKAGDAPKARNFALNLIGQSDMATIDVWAARFLNRMAGKKRIPVIAEGAVAGNWNADVTYPSGAYGFGAKAMEHAASKLRQQGIDITAPDLQAVVWFVEKELWTKNNWTTKAGEGGSFEEELDKTKVDRYQAGATIAQEDKVPLDSEMADASKDMTATLGEDKDVVAFRALPTIGMYAGSKERSFDQEVIANKGWNPSKWISDVARISKKENQWDAFVSRVLGDNESHPNARSGMEIFFRTNEDMAKVKPMLDKIVENGIDGFTLVVDPLSRKNLESGKEADKFIGVRLQYVPEIAMRWMDKESDEYKALSSGDDARVKAVLDEKRIKIQDAVKELQKYPEVAFAKAYKYDTLVMGKENYDDYIDRGTEGRHSPFGEDRSRMPIAERLKGAASRLTGGERNEQSGAILQRSSDGIEETKFSRKDLSPISHLLGDEDLSPLEQSSNKQWTQDDKEAVRQLWIDYSSDDENAFRHKTSPSKDISEIVKAINPKNTAKDVTKMYAGVKVKPENGERLIHVVINKEKNGKTYSKDAYLQIFDNEKVIEINVMGVGEGFGGSEIYNIAHNWAVNNGYVFEGDRDGISVAGMKRRTEQMISQILKYGSSKNIAPHPKQKAFIAEETGVPLIYSTKSPMMQNLDALLQASYDLTILDAPEIKNVIYNPTTKQFERTGTGSSVGAPYTERDFRDLASKLHQPDSDRFSEGAAGVDTLKRAALTNTILNARTASEKRRIVSDIKQASIQRIPVTEKLLYSRKPVQFYSHLSKAVEKANDKIFTNGNAVASWLNANASQSGVKKDELFWSGVEDWLRLQGKNKVTKADVLAYLDANGVQVHDVMLNDNAISLDLRKEFSDRGFDIRWDLSSDDFYISDRKGNYIPRRELPSSLRNALEDNEESVRTNSNGNTRYSGYVVAGGTEYREMLITLPVKEPRNLNDIANEMFGKRFSELEDDDANSVTREELKEKKSANFRSQHFDQENILAHLRFDTRTDADGRKVLFINEIQSDWGQKGKKEGFISPEGREKEIAEAEKDFNEYVDQLRAKYGVDKSTHFSKAYQQATEDERKKYGRLANRAVGLRDNLYIKAAVPSAPFVTDTEAWVSLALKKAIAHAVENGHEVIAWANGDQNANLYDLSKQVDGVQVWGDAKDGYYFQANKDGRIVVADKGKPLTESELADNIGKELAAKAVSDIAQGYVAEYEGENLKVGGEGMKAFYDQIVPQIANKVLKKVGGGKVENVKFNTAEVEHIGRYFQVEVDGEKKKFSSFNNAIEYLNKFGAASMDQMGFVITPAMKEKASTEGLPMFARKQTDTRESNELAPNGYLYHTTDAKDEILRDGLASSAFEVAYDPDTGEYLDEGNYDEGRQVIWFSPNESNVMGRGGVTFRVKAEDVAKFGELKDGNEYFAGSGVYVESDKPFNIPVDKIEIKDANGNWSGNNNQGIRFSRKSGLGIPESSKLDDIIYTLQDKNVDLKRVMEVIKNNGNVVADQFDTYLQEELFHGRASKRVNDFIHLELNPLIRDMRTWELSQDDLNEYLWARHAKEANDLIAERDPNFDDGGSGLTNAQVDDYFAGRDVKAKNGEVIIKGLDKDKLPALKQAAKQVDAMIAKTRDTYVKYELISDAQAKEWENMFQHYVPLMREDKDGGMGMGQGFHIKGKEVKHRTGSGAKVVEILANIAMQRERAITRGEKNRVTVSLLGLAKMNPDQDFWTFAPAPERRFNEKTGEVEMRINSNWKNGSNVLVGKIKDKKGNIQERAVIFDEGNERAVRMASAIKNMDATSLNMFFRASSVVTRYFASINTQYNPVFGIVNITRDVQGMLINLESTELAGHKAEVLKHVPEMIAGIYSDERNTRKGKQATSKNAHLWEELQSEGGMTGFREIFTNSEDRARAIQHELDPTSWTNSKWGKVFTAGGTLKVPLVVAQKMATPLFDWLSDYNTTLEGATRLAVYKVARDNGISKQRAASIAKNITVNFNRRGSVGQHAGALYAFFNAAMQGNARIAQTMFDMTNGDSKTIRLSKVGKAVVAGGITLGVLQAASLAAAGFGDDEPPEFLRERSLIIPIGDKKFISIPMPLGYHVLANIGRIPTEWAMSGFKNGTKRAIDIMGILADSYNPIGNAGLSMQTITPTAFDPIAALSENKDSFGKRISMPSFNSAEPRFDKNKDTATKLGKLIAEGVNTLTGGDQYVAGAINVSADQIDYLGGQLGGGVWREGAKLEQSLVSLVTGEELPTHKIPVVGRFYGDGNQQASQGGAYYGNIQKINEVKTGLKGRIDDGKNPSEFLKDNPIHQLIGEADGIDKAVKALRKQKQELIKNGGSKDKVKAIEKQITAMMKQLNDDVQRFESTKH